MVGRRKKDTFAYIKDRIWKRINSWRSRPLSRAGMSPLSWLENLLLYCGLLGKTQAGSSPLWGTLNALIL
ncbi:hypothetical protein P8452_16753 [Trifolium repens]|nr:hypothetical protein P8452_16753 [Trifolium repens]